MAQLGGSSAPVVCTEAGPHTLGGSSAPVVYTEAGPHKPASELRHLPFPLRAFFFLFLPLLKWDK